MDPLILALAGFCIMLALIALKVPIGVSMALCGVAGFAQIAGWGAAVSLIASEPASAMSNLDLSVIPLFMLMGSLAVAGGLATDIYDVAEALIGHRRGGLATTTIVASAGFGSVCGSAVATTATFGRVAMPEMLARGYKPGFAAGAVAAGGTLGIIVPPSGIAILYSVLSEQSILQLFAACVIPAMLAVLSYLIAIQISVRRDPDAAPPGEMLPLPARLRAARKAWSVIVLATAVLGGIYSGIFTVNEAASVGVFIAFLFLVMRGKLTRKTFVRILADASSASAMIYIMVFGANIFSYFISITGAAAFIINAIAVLPVPPVVIIFGLVGVYIFLGAFFDEVAALVITLPFVIPLMQHLGYDLIWWGVINIILIGLGMLTPPIGINVMLLNTMYREIPMGVIIRGVVPFICAGIFMLVILIAFPQLSLWLPSVLQ
ncbi:C4-dicarboxylate ABC transporter permease [Pannonibacter phragmitetus]|uniref:TRAP transporter large permease protein n=1 Tax=Pannonibacter phragmitetus TaxID=121719 RepID=A0A0L0IY18_9HYPH|nr:TRAP transporter large permease [Pannonibacter phragmitetus]ALV30467.1 C4-dicarboxylate ABC transporter permease [Pannonibacter phragmitetus]KND18198.1 C4-dicarboxylate ABC transporter permease [Pannonibacter phragmitetus]